MPKAKRPSRGMKVDATGRSKGGEPHVRIHHWELKSAAYRSLCLGARVLLVELKALYVGYNNGELFLSVREAARRMNVGKNLADKCFGELEDKGFIRPNRLGSFNWKDGSRRGLATSWILTEFAFGDAIPTKDFMRWQPSEHSEAACRRKKTTVPARGSPGPPGGDTGPSIAPDCPRDGDTPAPVPMPDGPSEGHTGKLPSGVPEINGYERGKQTLPRRAVDRRTRQSTGGR